MPGAAQLLAVARSPTIIIDITVPVRAVRIDIAIRIGICVPTTIIAIEVAVRRLKTLPLNIRITLIPFKNKIE